MINLKLNETEKKILHDVLTASLSNLQDEIAHTDTREYRDHLKTRREVLNKIKGRLH